MPNFRTLRDLVTDAIESTTNITTLIESLASQLRAIAKASDPSGLTQRRIGYWFLRSGDDAAFRVTPPPERTEQRRPLVDDGDEACTEE